MSSIIKGTVFNYLKKPIEGATVTVQNSYPEIETKTDKNGNFEIQITGNAVLVFKHKNTNQELLVGASEKNTEPLVISMMNELEAQAPVPCKKSYFFPALIFSAGILTGVLLSGKEKTTISTKA